KQVVSEGQELILRIIRIDPQRRRMGLSLRRALDTPDAELVAIFGDEIIAERDALVQKVRESPEAEGLTGTRQDEPERSDGSAPVDVASIDSDALAREAGEPQVAAFAARRRRAAAA